MDKRDLTVVTPMFRISYPHVFKARRNDLNNTDEFSVTALFAKGEDLSVLKKAYETALTLKFGADKAKWPKITNNPFKNQGDKAKDGKLPDGLVDGAVMMTFKSKNRPSILDQNKQEILESSKFYAGGYARAQVYAHAYGGKGNNGVSFFINAAQFMKDGEPLSGRPSVESAFTPIETEGKDATDIF